MIDFYYWPTPNGWKVSTMLEECGADYRLIPVDIFSGDQFDEKFLQISPNNRMPAIVDHDTGREPITLFESGAILWYLAEKFNRFIPKESHKRYELMQWLFWQTGNQSPASGQLSHFTNFADGDHPYSTQRFEKEYHRCLTILEKKLEKQTFILGDYSIADMICWPWILFAKNLNQSLENYPNVKQWRQRLKERPGIQRGVDLAKEFRRKKPLNETERQVLFGKETKTDANPLNNQTTQGV